MGSAGLECGILNWIQSAARTLADVEGTDRDADALRATRLALDRAMSLARESAPSLWEVEAELALMVAGKPARCRLPQEFTAIPELAHGVGFSISLGQSGNPCLGPGETIELQTLRDALIAIGPTVNPPVLYFGPYRSVGHHLRVSADAGSARVEDLRRAGFPVEGSGLALSRPLDPGYCPGYDSEVRYRRLIPEVEGQAKLTHENGMTVLGVWDRSIDSRRGCHSTYIALGTYNYETMRELCKRAYEWRWNLLESRIPVVCIEKEQIS